MLARWEKYLPGLGPHGIAEDAPQGTDVVAQGRSFAAVGSWFIRAVPSIAGVADCVAIIKALPGMARAMSMPR